MLDLSRVEGARSRDAQTGVLVDRLLEVDAERRKLVGNLDGFRAERNAANQRMAAADKQSDDFVAARDSLRELSRSIKEKEQLLRELEDRSRELLLTIPNVPHATVPVGDESANEVISVWGERPAIENPQAHWDLGPRLGILDFEAAANMSGARFCILRGTGARLNRALIQFMLDRHSALGYEEIWPPTLVRAHALVGSSQLPKFAEDLFRTDAEDPYYLSPTAEVQLVNLHRESILEESELPRRYTAYSACFRSEAGSYGKDTRGLIRQHQFDKVELVKVTTPETSYDELESLCSAAEAILRELGLHYRKVALATGDLGFAATKTYDLEVWLPGQDAYREISSCSNCEDFQARRARIRYRPGPGAKPRFVHTLNGSGLAVGRTLVAILEQYQRDDGGVDIPAGLQPYLGGTEVIAAS